MKNIDRNFKSIFLCCYFSEIRFSLVYFIMLNNDKFLILVVFVEMKLLVY